MKQTRLVKILAGGAACAAALGIAFAQETTTTTTTRDPVTATTTTESATTTSTGTIAAYTPDSDYIMFRSSTAQGSKSSSHHSLVPDQIATAASSTHAICSAK